MSSSNPINSKSPNKPDLPSSFPASQLPSALWPRLTLLIIVAVVGGLLYRETLMSLVTAVLHREGSSHGVFVPFLSVFFLWIKRETLQEIEKRYDYAGVPLCIIGILFPVFYHESFHLQCLSFIVLLSGIIILMLGRAFFKEISFPLLFLITMIPIPVDTYSDLADITRDITFGGSECVIKILGLSYLREGYILYLPNAVLEVAEACSGIRYLLSYFVFSLAYAYLYREATWSRIAVVVSSIPISLIASILRLTFIFLLTYIFGPHMAEYWPHVFISWSVFFIVLVVSICIDQYFQNRKNARQD